MWQMKILATLKDSQLAMQLLLDVTALLNPLQEEHDTLNTSSFKVEIYK